MGEKRITRRGILHLLVVYFVWGSTYLAIRVGVRPGGGFPPFSFAALRVFTAGGLLLLWSWLRKKQIQISTRDFITLLISGLCLWIGGNGLVVWAEQQVDSAVAALIVASVPIWVAGVEAVLDQKPPTLQLVGSLLTGFLGILVLSMPVLLSGVRANMMSLLALFLASLSWSAGLVIQTRRPVQVGMAVSSGYQQLLGGIVLGFLALILREPVPQPVPEAWFAWGYLLVFGSLLAFTSFVSALQLLPTRVVTTYAYVNPLIAVLLGWVILSEPITLWTLAGAVLVLLGVSGVYREGKSSGGPPES